MWVCSLLCAKRVVSAVEVAAGERQHRLAEQLGQAGVGLDELGDLGTVASQLTAR